MLPSDDAIIYCDDVTHRASDAPPHADRAPRRRLRRGRQHRQRSAREESQFMIAYNYSRFPILALRSFRQAT